MRIVRNNLSVSTESKKRIVDPSSRTALARRAPSACRDKDIVFTRELARRGLVSRDRLLTLLDQTAMVADLRQRIRGASDFDSSESVRR